MLDTKVQQISQESSLENDKLKRDCDDIREVMSQRIAAIQKDHIKISQHEEILNKEIAATKEQIHE